MLPGLVGLLLQRQSFLLCSSFVARTVRIPAHGPWLCPGLLLSHATDRPVRSQRCYSAYAGDRRKRMIFLGTPEVAAQSLEKILQEAAKPEATFEVVGIVTQPGRPQGRGKKRIPQLSPVETVAHTAGVKRQHIFCPESAREGAFLDGLTALEPDLCITAAYGNILPQKFLDIPVFGTLNIHPSLLPAYRGAAPVQRAIVNGERKTGVSVAFTVRACDAGPVLAQQSRQIDDVIQAPQLLQELFQQGTELLLINLPHVWTGQAGQQAQPQDEAAASHAAKLTKADSLLDFQQPAKRLHDQVGMLQLADLMQGILLVCPPWDSFMFVAGAEGKLDGQAHPTHFSSRGKMAPQAEMELKILASQLAENAVQAPHLEHQQVQIGGSSLLVWCGDGRALELLLVQPAGKKPMSAQAFANGLGGSTLLWQQV